MAGLAPALPPPRAITAGQQFAAIAHLRWCLFRNGFRRKGAKGDLVARIIVFPIALIFLVGPVAGAVTASYAAASDGHLEYVAAILWASTLLQILVSINISAPGLSFDPESLIRFPLSLTRYVVVRLFLGLLSASTIVGTLCLLGAAAGLTYAIPALAPAAFAVALALALCNMLFVRMVFAWVDRWLSTRRARELFTVAIFALSIGFQYVNATFNGIGGNPSPARQQARMHSLLRVYHFLEPALHSLPAGLAGVALVHSGPVHDGDAARMTPALLPVAGILIYSALFLGVFAWRMQREYRGESLSELSAPPSRVPHASTASIHTEARPLSAAPDERSLLPPLVAAGLQKEWIHIRRNPAQFAGLVMPLAMVFIFAGRLGSFGSGRFMFPSAAAYSVLTTAVLAYNILGLDASGVQFYFIAPISIRSVFLAKNLFGFMLTAAQVLMVYAVLCFSAGPPAPTVAIATLCWAALAALLNATIGNMRSITTPKKVDPSKLSRNQNSPLSVLLCMGLMVMLGAAGAGLLKLAQIAHLPWLPIPILAALAVGAWAFYIAGLNRVDALALSHRETLIEELSKAS